MSGTNPFRRKENAEVNQAHQNPLTTAAGTATADRAELRFPPIHTGGNGHTSFGQPHLSNRDPTERPVDVPKSTKGKTVRIISPHYSRSKEAYGASTVTSPPPMAFMAPAQAETDSPSSEEPSPVDPFTAQSDEGISQDDDEDLRRNTIANATKNILEHPAHLRNSINPIDTVGEAPALSFGADTSIPEVREQSKLSNSMATGYRPHYDVDDFKRLLLTGEKLQIDENASATNSPATVQGPLMGDSNSNTDASSVSRQSIFEPQPELHPESPSTPMDVPLSDDERNALVHPSPKVERARPSVPPSRHGKLVKQNVPLTLSFESLSSSPPGPSSLSTFPAVQSPLATPGISRDINKPLPFPPRPSNLTPIESNSDMLPGASGNPQRSSNLPHSVGKTDSKRSPPVPPAARRKGQARSRSSTNDSSRSTSISEELSQNTHPSPTNSASTPSSKPPPLPPPRGANTHPGQENSGPTSGMISSTESMELPAFKPRPPAPPSRTPSTTSIKRMSRISNSGSPAPAPPPPPRRRGSSQSQGSFTPSRLSGEYRISSSERTRSSSGASTTQQPTVPEPQMAGKDIMADLTALQREVDELRGKFGR